MSLIKKANIIFMASLLCLGLVSCTDDDDSVELGNWVKSSTFNGDSRSGAVSFTIGDKGYLVTGYDGDDYLTETWEYDSEKDSWSEIKTGTFPGVGRSGAVAFSIGDYGYVGTGKNDDDDEMTDFYKFDPTNGTWTQIADFGGTGRYGAIGFSVNNFGYVGTGDDGSELKDFWKYDPNTDTWTEISGFGGEKRKEGSVFVIDDVAYIGFGTNDGLYEQDFYSFDGVTEEFKKLKPLDYDDDNTIIIANSAAFSINGKGYVSTGLSVSLTSETWEYDPATDEWEEKPEFEGTSRQDASAFTFDDSAYVLMGRSGSYYFDDVWKFNPEEEENEDD